MTGTTATKLVPGLNQLIVERSQSDDTSSGGIVLPDQSKVQLNKGRVLAVGPIRLDDGHLDFAHEYSDALLGRVVHFGEYAGVTVISNETEFLAVSMNDVLAYED